MHLGDLRFLEARGDGWQEHQVPRVLPEGRICTAAQRLYQRRKQRVDRLRKAPRSFKTQAGNRLSRMFLKLWVSAV